MAQRLAELKLVRAGFAVGELSFSKVRAISRVATAETEATLVELARHATANHMEQIARAYRRLKRRMAKNGQGKDQKDGGYLHWYWDDDGYLVIVGRFPPEEGTVFIQELNAARSALAGEPEKDQPGAADSAESRPSSPDQTDPDHSAESLTSSPDQSDSHDSAESRTSSPDPATPDDSAESLASPAEHSGRDDSAESQSDPRDSAESRMLAAGAAEGPAAATGSPDSAERRWATPGDDSAESRWAEEDDDSAESLWAEEDEDYLNGYWMVPEDEESGELVWVTGEVPEDDDSAQAPPAFPGDNNRSAPEPADSSRDSAESRPTAADALLSMAETMLRYGPQARDGGDRYQAV